MIINLGSLRQKAELFLDKGGTKYFVYKFINEYNNRKRNKRNAPAIAIFKKNLFKIRFFFFYPYIITLAMFL